MIENFKIALFGGTFDPIHRGHRTCIEHLARNMEFSNVVLIPANQNPLKTDHKPASKEDRLKMIQMTLKDYEKTVSVDPYEIMKEAPSYSIETLERYEKKYSPKQLYLVMGLDVFSEFDQWKDFERIVEKTNLLVIGRPLREFPKGVEDFPKALQPRVFSFKEDFHLLDTGCGIGFLKIKTEEISSSLIREKRKKRESLYGLVNPQVEKYICENGLYLD